MSSAACNPPNERASSLASGRAHGLRNSDHETNAQASSNDAPALNSHNENCSQNGTWQQATPPCREPSPQAGHRENPVHEAPQVENPPNINNHPAENRRTRRKRTQKAVRAGIKIASLNMRGYGTTGQQSQNKWNHINQVMRDERIGTLLLQETHMDDNRHSQTQNLFDRSLRILHSADLDNPTRKGGVAIVLNKRFVPTDNTAVSATEIIEGRALLLNLKISEQRKIKILVVYAPNDSGSNRDFWIRLKAFFEQNPTKKPDILAGDFNMVEDAIDRLPAHSDQEDTAEALDELKQTLRLEDGWRNTFPTTLAYTYLQSNGTGSQSRIDRIYTKSDIIETAREWKISTSGLPNADHRMVSFQIVDENTPTSGSGRWSIKPHLLRDEPLGKYIEERGNEALQKIEELEAHGNRTTHNNPQTIYAKFKRDIIDMARKRERAIMPKLILEIHKCECELDRVNNDLTITQDERVTESKTLTKRLTDLKRKQHLKRRCAIATKNRVEGETITRSWIQNNKEKKSRDVIHALRKSGPLNIDQDPYEKNSTQMAELARKYHEALQKEEININQDQREQCTEETLNSLKTQTTENQQDLLRRPFSEEETENALNKSDNNKSAGIDGTIYELWKHLLQKYKNANNLNNQEIDNNKPQIPQTKFNIIKLMTAVFNDIHSNGMISGTDFSLGWMCPIYKKNDRNEIANYRPITILNSDYKIMTKILAQRLAQVVPTLLHKSQAGFIPGRSISEQTKLIELMINYAEVSEQNGVIIALDQEKAYDKIAHDYLWKVLRAFGIPEEFITTVKALYQEAETHVMINGHLSSKFRVTRGVRQGDPMSCLLFDLAIEPLAASLRDSQLKGYEIPGSEEKLIANLFADDTTTFLSAEDNMDDLENILTKWCKASSAKFNIQKTEVIPIGTPEYRAQLVETRKINNHSTEIPPHIHIAKDGEPVRILGTWIGNKIDDENVWTPLLGKIDRALERWEKGNPTIEGRKLVVQMVVGGMTQYLTQVQGMPTAIEKRLEKRIRKFIWGERTLSPVNFETVLAPIQKGGRSVLDIKTRNEAIDLMWLKSYLQFDNNRPLWALVADAIMAEQVPQSELRTDKAVRLNIFLQNWKTLSGPKAPKTIKKLVKTAKRFTVRLEGHTFSPSISKQMPIWLHIKADKKSLKRHSKTIAGKCLIKKHKAISVGKIIDLADTLENIDHVPDPNCLCETCLESGDKHGCEDPHQCFIKAYELLNLLPSKWNPKIQMNIGYDEEIINNAHDPQGLQRIKFTTHFDQAINGAIPATKVYIATETFIVGNTTKLVSSLYYGLNDPKMTHEIPPSELKYLKQKNKNLVA